MKVLVIEDDRDNRELVASKLEHMGHSVRTETDGESGLAAALATLPDLVVLAVMIPKLTGIEICQRLRDEPTTAGVRIVLITSMSQDADVERGLGAGADAYIVKPFSSTELADCVELLFGPSQEVPGL